LQIGEVERALSVAYRCHRNDPRGRASHEKIQEQVRQQEASEVIHGECRFDAVNRRAARLVHASRIVDEHIEAIVARAERRDQLTDRRLG
jgi:hypothetical protein